MRPEIASHVEWIRNDREHGANYLAADALRALVRAADSREEFCEAARALFGLRPCMTVIDNSILDMVQALADVGEAELKAEARRFVEQALAEAELAEEALIEHALRIINPSRRASSARIIFTLTYSSTVFGILARSRPKKVVVAESRPRCEGATLARLLAQEGVPTALVTDAAAGHFLPTCDAVLVGADSIGPDGSVVNKMGTYLFALAAHSLSMPVYAAARTIKIRQAAPIVLEQMDPSEVAPPITGVEITNTCFDLTPADLITSIITEQGIVGPEEVFELQVDRSAALAALGA